MKNILFLILLFTTTLMLQNCGQSNSNSTAIEKPNVQKVDLIIDIKSIAGQPLTEIEKILGKAESTEKVKGYPCENIKCTRCYFKNGKYEILFKNKVANRITINSIPNLTDNDNAIEALGLPLTKYSFKNPNSVIRWTNVQGIEEVSFNYDFIYITVTKN